MEEFLQPLSGGKDFWDISHSVPLTIGFVILIICLIILKKRTDKKRHEEMYSKMKSTKGKTMEEIKKEIDDQFGRK